VRSALSWCRDIIYTYTGPILIAVNPFKSLPLYTDRELELYRNEGQAKATRLAGQAAAPADDVNLAPHIFVVADSAFRAMIA
jgi:myosin heavy subunit